MVHCGNISDKMQKKTFHSCVFVELQCNFYADESSVCTTHEMYVITLTHIEKIT